MGGDVGGAGGMNDGAGLGCMLLVAWLFERQFWVRQERLPDTGLVSDWSGDCPVRDRAVYSAGGWT